MLKEGVHRGNRVPAKAFLARRTRAKGARNALIGTPGRIGAEGRPHLGATLDEAAGGLLGSACAWFDRECRAKADRRIRNVHGMKTASTEIAGFQGMLERKQAELARVLRKRDDIVIEKSADQMDEIQYASERDLAIRNVDRDSTLLRQVKAALRRIATAASESALTANRRSATSASQCRGLHAVSTARRPQTARGRRERMGPRLLVNAA